MAVTTKMGARRYSTFGATWRFFCLMLSLLLTMASVDCHAAGETGRIGVSVTDLGNPFFVRAARGVERSARQLFGAKAKVYVMSSAYDLHRQIAQIDFFIARKVDLIVLIAADPLAIEPAVRRAQAHGIPVVALDVRAAGADLTVTTDNVQAGELACQYIVDRLKGQGDVVIISGPPVSATIDRMSGCRASLAQSPGIRLLSADRNGGGSSEGGFAKMTDLLTRYAHIDAVFAINDPTALGAEKAAQEAGRRELFIVGVDGAPRVKARMRDSESIIAATVAQMPDLLASKAVELGYDLIRKKPVHNPVLLIPAILLTADSESVPGGWEE